MRESNRRSGIRRRYIWTLGIALLSGAFAPQGAAQNGAPQRVVAIGDIHGDFDAFRGILQQAGIVDAVGRWIAGRTTLVQTGDFTDRGPKVRAAMDLLMDLEEQAPAAGGRVQVLLGNHEVLNIAGEGRDVTPAIYATFADEQSEQRRQAAYEAYVKLSAARSQQLRRPGPRIDIALSKDNWMAAHPPGFVEYRDAFGPEGRYGRWLRTKPVVLQLGDTVFQHAGINPDEAPRRLEDINKQVLSEIKRIDEYRNRMIVRNLILPFSSLDEMLAAARAELQGGGGQDGFDNPDPLDLEGLLRSNSWALFNPNGPMWFRGFATWSATEGPPQIAKLLRRYAVAHFVVGHTVPSTMRVTPRFNGAVFLIDTGMLSSVYKGGVASAVEIRDGRFTAISENQRTTVFEGGYAVPPTRR
jgi:hypothetical protein